MFTPFGSLAADALTRQSALISLMDCSKDVSDLKCKRSDPKQAGGIADGPVFAQGIGDKIAGGFIKGDKLIVSSNPRNTARSLKWT